MRLAESERSVMNVIWEDGTVPAKHIAAVLGEQIGWSKTTTYTVIKRCMDKGYIRRDQPSFLCTAMLTREQVAVAETDALIKNGFRGSALDLVEDLLRRGVLTLDDLHLLIEEMED